MVRASIQNWVPVTQLSVGMQEILQTVFVAAVRNGELLMVQHGGTRTYGLWGLPGGHVDPGETIQDAAVRETLEEAGCRVKLGRLIDRRVLDSVAYCGGPSDDGHDIVVQIFEATPLSEAALPAGAEELAVRWVSFGEVAALPQRWAWLPEFLKVLQTEA